MKVVSPRPIWSWPGRGKTACSAAISSSATSADAVDQAKAGSGPYNCAEPPHRCSQIYLEAILREAAVAQSSVDVRFGHRLEEFREVDGGIVTVVRTSRASRDTRNSIARSDCDSECSSRTFSVRFRHPTTAT